MRNTGSATWTRETYFRLGSQNPENNTIWGGNRVDLPVGITTLPGAEWAFTFYITAPTEVGSYNFQWRMVEEGIGWFGEFTENLLITVEEPTLLWEFNTDGDAEGWYPGNQLTPFTISGGTLKTTATGVDPYMVSQDNMNVNGSELKYVIVRMKVSTGNAGAIYFTTPDDQTFDEAKAWWFTVTPGTEFKTYSIDMSVIPKWASGTVHELRLDPTWDSPEASIEIDYIRLSTLPESYDITFVATAPGISDLHEVDINDVTDPGNPLYLGRT